MTLAGWHEDSEGEGLRHVLNGAYDVPGLEFERPPRIIDCGANIGCFSIWASKRWPNCPILAFEPNRATYEALVANVAPFPFVCPIRAAVHAVTQTAPLYEGIDDRGREAPACSSLMRLVDRQQDRGQVVQVLSATALPPCDILKIDTEGSEMPILVAYSFLEGVRACMVEYHTGAGLVNERERISELLTGAGLALVRENAGTGEMVWVRT